MAELTVHWRAAEWAHELVAMKAKPTAGLTAAQSVVKLAMLLAARMVGRTAERKAVSLVVMKACLKAVQMDNGLAASMVAYWAVLMGLARAATREEHLVD